MMGAAQGNLAGREIVEQSSCALHLCKVELSWLSPGAGCHRAAIESYMTGEFDDFLFSPALAAQRERE
jgi:hypothetical protein